jgi:hypothetical protein
VAPEVPAGPELPLPSHHRVNASASSRDGPINIQRPETPNLMLVDLAGQNLPHDHTAPDRAAGAIGCLAPASIEGAARGRVAVIPCAVQGCVWPTGLCRIGPRQSPHPLDERRAVEPNVTRSNPRRGARVLAAAETSGDEVSASLRIRGR